MKTLAHNIHTPTRRKQLFRMFLGGIVLSFVLYGFAIANTTLSIADADTSNQEINELQTQIAELEVEYFEMLNTLSMDEAKSFGFNEVQDLRYARINETKAVAYNL